MSIYADLRSRGQITLAFDDARLISSLRRRAKRDGLQVVSHRLGNSRDISRDQARRRPYAVALVNPFDLTTIVAPDAE